MVLAKKAGINLVEQKKARKALRTLVGKLGESDKEQWLGIITEAITAEIGIFSYIKAVSVRGALEEASPDDALNTRILEALKGSGMLPTDIPIEVSDLEKTK